MSSRKRSKALKRVTKLLNLATSNVDHEADLALNHAHNVIYNHNIQPEEIDPEKLCDRNVLAQIDWYGDWTERPELPDAWELEEETEIVPRVQRPVVIREINRWQQRPQGSAEEAEVASSAQRASSESNDDPVEFDAPRENDLLHESEASLEMEPDASPAETADDINTDPATPDFDQIVESGAFMVFEREATPPITCDDGAEDQLLNAELDTEAATDCQQVALRGTTELAESPVELTTDLLDDESADEDTEVFDEGAARVHLAEVIDQIIEAKNLYTAYRDEREQGDIDEEAEKAVRVAAEIEAEEAIERAFRERAEEQLRWESEMSQLRQQRRYREQNALKRLRALRDEHEALKQRLAAHESWKEEQARLALLDEISSQLQVAADHVADSENPAFERALTLMDENGLRLQDLPLARIHHKSIFMRLLEREVSTLEVAAEKEAFTQSMLKAYLAVYHPPTVDLAGRVLELLKVASSGSENAEDAFCEARDILEKNSMSIRDLDIGQIDQISLFVRLLNWEADQLRDMDAREHFTAKMLDRYFEATATL